MLLAGNFFLFLEYCRYRTMDLKLSNVTSSAAVHSKRALDPLLRQIQIIDANTRYCIYVYIIYIIHTAVDDQRDPGV